MLTTWVYHGIKLLYRDNQARYHGIIFFSRIINSYRVNAHALTRVNDLGYHVSDPMVEREQTLL